MFAACGFAGSALFSWVNEALDLPYYLLSAPPTAYNWREAFVESILISMIGFFTVLQLKKVFHKRQEAERKLMRAQTALKLEKQKLEEVLNIDCEISSILKLNQLIDFIIDQAVKLLGIKRCSLMMLDPHKKKLIIKGAYGLHADVIKETRLGLGERLAGKVAQTGKPLLVRNIHEADSLIVEPVHTYSSASFMIVPVVLHKKVVGVINVSEKETDNFTDAAFTQVDLKILSRIVHQAAISIENASYYQELEFLTRTDSLTGLYNHRYFVQAMDREIERARRYERPLSVIMIDVDDFKSFNDTYGHLEGDHLLKRMSKAMRKVARDVDICCRYAGDEFVIILPETNVQQARRFAQKIQKAIKSVRCQGQKVSASLGVAEYTNYRHDRIDLVRKADQFLYEAKKKKGRAVWNDLYGMIS
jgi:diguanylate cyclase (GGDEF)-like protein